MYTDEPPDTPRITLTQRVAEALLELAPQAEENALPEDEVLELMPEGTSRATFRNVTASLLEEGTLRRCGTGTRGDPHRFWIGDTDTDSGDA